MSVQTAYLGLGANLGSPHETLVHAIAQLKQSPDLQVTGQSGFWKTAPVDATGPDFCNAVIQVQTGLAPLELIDRLLDLEQLFGRIRSVRNAPRTLDLDLIAMDGVQMMSDRLTLPHPRAHLRAFVLVPLCEINPDVLLGDSPATQQTAGQWRSALPADELGKVRPW